MPTYIYKDELYHHGVKGMRWGVWNEDTKQRYLGGQKVYRTPEEKGYVKIGSSSDGSVVKVGKQDRKWFEQATGKGFIKTYNTAVETINDVIIPNLNKKWANVDIDSDEVKRAQYDKEAMDGVDAVLNTVGNYNVYHSPSGELMISYNMGHDGNSIWPEFNVYSRNKDTVRAKKLEEADDRARERFNKNLDRLNAEFNKKHGISDDFDLDSDEKLFEEYNLWMMDQYDKYTDEERSKVKL